MNDAFADFFPFRFTEFGYFSVNTCGNFNIVSSGTVAILVNAVLRSEVDQTTVAGMPKIHSNFNDIVLLCSHWIR